MIRDIEIHEVGDALEHRPIIDYDVSHSELNFRDGERQHNKDFVQLNHDNFGLLENLIIHIKLHFNILELVGPVQQPLELIVLVQILLVVVVVFVEHVEELACFGDNLNQRIEEAPIQGLLCFIFN